MLSFSEKVEINNSKFFRRKLNRHNQYSFWNGSTKGISLVKTSVEFGIPAMTNIPIAKFFSCATVHMRLLCERIRLNHNLLNFISCLFYFVYILLLKWGILKSIMFLFHKPFCVNPTWLSYFISMCLFGIFPFVPK